MISPEIPNNEVLRQRAVEKYQLLDTLPEESFDNITSLMAYVCDVPISLITLLDKDRNFLKSHHGVPFNESPREISFCGHAINAEDAITIIEDARVDERFHDNPLVAEHQAIFYAGVPLVDPQGFKLGTLCVYDTKPRTLSEAQINALSSMAKQVMRLFEERYQNLKLKKLQKRLVQRNKNLEKFAGVVSHDLKSPLAQITALTQLLEDDLGKNLSEETVQYLEYIRLSSDTLRGYIDGLLQFYRTDGIVKQKKETLELTAYMEEIQNMFVGDQKATINFLSKLNTIKVNKAALTQILVNLIANGIKHNDKTRPVINVSMDVKDTQYYFTVADNGPGIPKENQKSIFDLFTTIQKTDRFGNEGTGIGLATVKKMVTSLGGKIGVYSEEGEGSIFSFSIDKEAQ